MKRFFLIWTLFSPLLLLSQQPHLFEHSYPSINEEDVRIRTLMNEVSVDSLTTTINQMTSFHTRRYDSQMIYDVQDWLVGRMQNLDLDTVYLHDFKLHGLGITETADNVIGVQWGTVNPDEFVVCGAHYDSYCWDGYDPDTIRSPGADDNATGVAGILETARILSRCKFERSIIYCGFCAEECGLKGSEAYAQDCAAQRMDIVGYFNLDMTGYLEPGDDIHIHLLYTTRDSLIADYVKNFSHVYFPDMPIRQNWLSGGDTDYSSFNRSGYAAISPSEDVHHMSPYIHTRDDIMGLSVNNLDQSKRFTELNLGTVATLAGLLSAGTQETDSETLQVFPNPASERITITGPQLQSVELINVLGQTILHLDTVYNKTININTSSLNNGIYLIRSIDDNMNIYINKIIINH